MYDFRDTTSKTASVDRPAEAVSINGLYIEDAIPGYRTLYTQGRDALAKELDSYSVAGALGDRVKGTRYPSRTIKVGFQLIAPDPASFREAFNHLNNILSVEEADFVFRDEADKYYTGYPICDCEIAPGELAVTGEWSIFCPDPCKRSINMRVLESTDPSVCTVNGNTAVFSFDYAGSYPARPVLEAEFTSGKSGGNYNEDGDCGFVAFMDSAEHVIQLGNPEAVDPDEFDQRKNVINQELTSVSDWSSSGTKPGVVQISDPYWDSGEGWTAPCASRPSSGTASMYKQFNSVTDFDLTLMHRFCVNKTKELGIFAVSALDANGAVVAGIRIEKTASGTKGKVIYVVNGKDVGNDSIDLSLYNTHFGLCKRTEVFTTQYYNKTSKTWQDAKIKSAKTRKVSDGYNYTQAKLMTSVVKYGASVTFTVGNLKTRTFSNDEIATKQTRRLEIAFKQKGSSAVPHINAVQSVQLTELPSADFLETSNVFTAGDVVQADCNDASVMLMRRNSVYGELAPQYGAIGNDWERFVIERGANTISVAWSDWVNQSYRPTIRIKYNEVFL